MISRFFALFALLNLLASHAFGAVGFAPGLGLNGNKTFRSDVSSGEGLWEFINSTTDISSFAGVKITTGNAGSLWLEKNSLSAIAFNNSFIHADGNLLLYADNPAGVVRIWAGTNILNRTQLLFTNGAVSVPMGSFAIGPAGVAITNILTASLFPNFPSTPAQSSSDVPISLAGLRNGDVIQVGVNTFGAMANVCFTGFVSNSQAFVRFNNYSAGALQPNAGLVVKIMVTTF
jgi:hypothetical protein